MKLLTIAFFAAIALSSVALAQTSRPTGTEVGRMLVTTSVINPSAPASEVKKRIISEIIVFVTSGGQNEYSINTSTIRFTGDGVDPSTSEVYGSLATAAVIQGIQMGYTPCNCNGGVAARVWAESCVVRTGTGLDTHFTPVSGTAYSTRDFSACGTTSSPVVTLLKMIDPGCNGGIQ